MSELKSILSVDEDHPLNFREISVTPMGETNVKYCSTEFLGKGRTAIVYPGYHFGIIKPTAVKLINKPYLRSDEDHINELKIWSNVNQNIYIIRLYDSHKTKNGIFLAMELADRTFREQITNKNPLREEIVKWLYQVSSAVEYLHDKGVLHRDIKPDNILMVQEDEKNIVAKLGDFGVSKLLSNAEGSGTFSNANGTILWMAPEAITNQTGMFKNTRMLDIYGLGMLIYYGLSLGRHPFSKSDNDDLSKVLSDMTSESAKPFKLEVYEAAANDLISMMLQRLPENRPQISEVVSHCLFWNWEKEQQFIFRTAICLSKKKCDVIEKLIAKIDENYFDYYCELNQNQSFNWINIAADQYRIDIQDLFFSIPGRKKPTEEYGNGRSVTKFLKFFRDKLVHYPDMKPEATIKFSESEGLFGEKKYVKVLTSICPGIVYFMYRTLQMYASEPSLIPLSEIYFPGKVSNNNKECNYAGDIPLVVKLSDEKAFRQRCDDENAVLQEEVERLGNSDVYWFKDSYITDHIKRGYFQTPSIPVAIKTSKISPDHTEMLLRTREFWMDIWSVKRHESNPFLISVYSLVEQYEVFHIAMELAPSSLYLEVTNGTIKMPNDVNQVTSYLQNIAEAVGWLHKKYKPHYRISPKNVFIFQQEENLKIAKLGISDPNWYGNFCYANDDTDISLMGKLARFSFCHEDTQIKLSSSKMYIANNLINWMNQCSNKPTICQVLDHPLFWNDEQSLQLICDFSYALRQTVIRWDFNMINPKSSTYFYTKTSKDPYTWTEKIDSRLYHGLSKKDLKSFPSLLELIEKIVKIHSAAKKDILPRNIDDDAIRELFYTENNSFSKTKVLQYFTERFPELTILCFCATMKYKLNNWRLLGNYASMSYMYPNILDWLEKMPFIIDA